MFEFVFGMHCVCELLQHLDALETEVAAGLKALACAVRWLSSMFGIFVAICAAGYLHEHLLLLAACFRKRNQIKPLSFYGNDHLNSRS